MLTGDRKTAPRRHSGLEYRSGSRLRMDETTGTIRRDIYCVRFFVLKTVDFSSLRNRPYTQSASSSFRNRSTDVSPTPTPLSNTSFRPLFNGPSRLSKAFLLILSPTNSLAVQNSFLTGQQRGIPKPPLPLARSTRNHLTATVESDDDSRLRRSSVSRYRSRVPFRPPCVP